VQAVRCGRTGAAPPALWAGGALCAPLRGAVQVGFVNSVFINKHIYFFIIFFNQ
jgi:hypothetical protein